ncbi:MAG: hypothetical protein RJA22_2693 [Verrucomicrobiota bacterium]
MAIALALGCALAPRALAQSSVPLSQVQALLQRMRQGGAPGTPVQFKGAVLFHEPAEKVLVVGDDTGSVLVETTGGELGLAPGQAVSVQGVTGVALGAPAVVSGAVSTRVGHQKLSAKAVDMAEVVEGTVDYQLVELEGLVTTLAAGRGRAMLHLHSGGSHLDAPIRDLRFTDRASATYQDSRVRVRGVVLPYRDERARGQNRKLLVINSVEDIQVTLPAAPPTFDLPATPIDHVPRITTECRILIQGRVSLTMTNRVIQVRDHSGQIPLHLDSWFTVRRGDFVEALGYPTLAGTTLSLDHCTLRILAPRQAPIESGVFGPSPLVPVLRYTSDIVGLPPEPDSVGLPVRFQAMVAGTAPHLDTVFLSGRSNAIRAVMAPTARRAASLQPGQIVEVSGYTAIGGFIPHLVEARAVPVAEGSLPLPRELSYDALASGKHDNERVTIRGIVRAVRQEGPVDVLEVAASGGRFPVLLPARPDISPPTHLVDAEVAVRGICSVIPNQRQQARGFRIHASAPKDIQVERPAPPDPFQLDAELIADLFRYNQQRPPGHRTKIRGTVTLQRNPQLVYLRGRTGSIRIDLADPMDLQAGDLVEVVGFPVLHDHQARLEDAVLHVTGRTNAPTPTPLQAGRVLNDPLQADNWVSMEGRVLEVRTGPDPATLALEADQQVFEVRFLGHQPGLNLAELERGSLVRVAGICQFKYSDLGQPRSFSLMAGSPAALTVLRGAPWLTTSQAGVVLASLVGIALAALAWVTLLRRQVRKQTRVILDLNANLERRVAERTAELEAANRELESFSYSVSHDLRAPLRAVNGFAEVLLQTHGPQLDERGSRYLRQVAEGGRRMGRLVDDLLTFSRLGRQPVRRAPLDLHLLASRAIEELRRQQPQRSVEVRLLPLPPASGDRPLIEQVLINLLGNAWKFTSHQPKPLLEIGSLTQGGEPVYYVRDNGAGFDMKYADKLFGVFQRLHAEDEFPGTGVGLAIVQRILHRHGGRIWAESRPGQGATFFFTLPTTDASGNPDAAGHAAPGNEPAQAFGK